MNDAPSRRQVLAGGLAAAVALGAAAPDDLAWGVIGEPLSQADGIAPEAELDLARSLGFTRLRVGLTGASAEVGRLEALIELGRGRGVSILPVLSGGDLDRASPKRLKRDAFDLARGLAERFRGRVAAWELGEELETFALLQPCERRDDGSRHPCEWGPASGAGPGDYFGPRWARVSAVLAGFSEGVAAGDAAARRAIGAGGPGHLGAFERLVHDGVAWDATVWRDHGGVSEGELDVLSGYGKPIWITALGAPPAGAGPLAEAERASRLVERIAFYRVMAPRFGVQAAFVERLLDPVGGAGARDGLVEVERGPGGAWRAGRPKASAEAVGRALKSGRRTTPA